MKQKLLVWIFATFLVVAIAPAAAQQPAKIHKIGFLSPVSPTSASFELFLREFWKLGYAEGKNVTREYRYAEDKLDRLPALAEELVRLKVDVLVTPGGNGALALKKATSTIPIVFYGAVSEPVGMGLVDSLARPGGNVTGFTTIAEDLIGKRLELLKETIPKLSRVAVLWDPKSPVGSRSWKENLESARELGLQLHSMEVDSADKYDNAFKAAIKARATALAVTQHSLASSNRKRIAELATKYRLPAIYYRGDFVEEGGLMSYGADRIEPYTRSAALVDKILKGTKPADLPVEQPKKFEFIANLKAAKQIGLTIPPNVLVRADRVIK